MHDLDEVLLCTGYTVDGEPVRWPLTLEELEREPSATARVFRFADGNGEIGFSEGQIVDARLGSVRGEEAFYQMLTLADGEFRIDPDYKLTERTIDVSPEGLVLEGMRRLDEGMLK